VADDLTPMAQEAIGYHVMFEALVEGGFTESQALRLLANIIAAQGRDQDGGETDG
jgi:hypothetical protein